MGASNLELYAYCITSCNRLCL